jgi:WhiB family transcriptional regulator, redox-sensing transcriptional regulator
VVLMEPWTSSPTTLSPFDLVARRLADRRPTTPPDTTWRADASCRDTDPSLFFPVGTTGPAITQIESAKEVCGACPAQIPCLEFALLTNQDSGVWGGTSEEERRHLRRTWLNRRRPAGAVSRPAAPATPVAGS